MEDKNSAFLALELYTSTKADFADALIGVRNRSAGCEATVTFDRAVGSLECFRLWSTS